MSNEVKNASTAPSAKPESTQTGTAEANTAAAPEWLHESGQAYQADICLLLEGTYPYVSGGVSSWVHSLINGMAEFTFYILVILPDKKERQPKYKVPKNVVKVDIMYLQDKSIFKKPFWKKEFNAEQWKLVDAMHMHMPFIGTDAHKAAVQGKSEFEQLITGLEKKRWNPSALLYSRKSWKFLVKLYHMRNSGVSFLDYFWTWRYMHAGIFSTLSQPIPLCKMYHTVSTGYAGLLAAKAKILHKRPVILTEHGIYSKERKIEISRASWIFESSAKRYFADQSISTFKQIWINAFRAMSRFCYDQSDEIITLFRGNQRLQMEDGAPVEKLKVIPNGVDFYRLNALKIQKQDKAIVGFVGRVVPIKDVKTFIRSLRLIANIVPNMEAWVLGPTDEDPDYFEECQQLVDNLSLQSIVKFFGPVNLMEFYPKVDVLVLTSISEGQPLVILEAQCLGIPCVSTDVGSCKELLEGSGEDEIYGHSGIITGMADPEGTALAVAQIINNPEIYKKMGEAGILRMKNFYDLTIFYRSYRELYQKYCSWQASASN